MSRKILHIYTNVKNPPVVYAKQANINNGSQQQVNNGISPRAPAIENENPPIKLVEAANGSQWTTTQRAALAQQIRSRRPREGSTGPKTTEGKARVARNAWKGGVRPALRAEMHDLKADMRALTCFEQFQ